MQKMEIQKLKVLISSVENFNICLGEKPQLFSNPIYVKIYRTFFYSFRQIFLSVRFASIAKNFHAVICIVLSY